MKRLALTAALWLAKHYHEAAMDAWIASRSNKEVLGAVIKSGNRVNRLQDKLRELAK